MTATRIVADHPVAFGLALYFAVVIGGAAYLILTADEDEWGTP